MIEAKLIQRVIKIRTNADRNVVEDLPKINGIKLPQKSLVRTPIKDTVKFLGTKSKSDPVTETTKSDMEQTNTDFIAWAKENNLNIEKLKSIINPKNEIGRGRNGIVYRIPENKKYVLKVPRSFNNCKIRSVKIESVLNNFPDLNIGQAIAKIDDYIYVLKKQKGMRGITSYEVDKYGQEKADKLYLRTMKLLAGMPQPAYNRLAQIYKILENKGFKVDSYRANHIFIDAKNKSINLVDVGSTPTQWSHNTAEDLFIPILNYTYLDSGHRITDSKTLDELINLRKQIIDMCIKACKEESLLPLSGSRNHSPEMEAIFRQADREGEWPQAYDEIMGF